MADTMASRISALKSLVPDLESALQTFTSSSSKFRIVRTVNPTKTQPKTLYILDSSFNPPSRAHLALATSALRDHAPSQPLPYRLLLLFSTHNADKAPSPASFAQRLALMTIFAEDVSQHLKSSKLTQSISAEDISIDIGVTTEPYYSDKSAAIDADESNCYGSRPRHVHLVGYDTLIRFLNPKYYPNHHPPLSALKPFFEAGHGLRVMTRPADGSDASSSAYGTLKEQEKYIEGLRSGDLDGAGFEREWAERIDVVAAAEGVGVSSTRVRKAAKEGEWDVVRKLCTEGVAGWIREAGLYAEDDSGKKMMG